MLRRHSRIYSLLLTGLGYDARLAVQCCSGRRLGVDGVGLAPASAGLAVGTVDLYDVDTFFAQIACQTGSVASGSFDTDLCQFAERAQPGVKLPIAFGRGHETRGIDNLASLVDHGCDMDVFMGIHPANDNLLFMCHNCNCLSLLLFDANGTSGRDGGQDSYGVAQGSYQVTSVRPAGTCTRAGAGPTNQEQGTKPVNG